MFKKAKFLLIFNVLISANLLSRKKLVNPDLESPKSELKIESEDYKEIIQFLGIKLEDLPQNHQERLDFIKKMILYKCIKKFSEDLESRKNMENIENTEKPERDIFSEKVEKYTKKAK